MSVDDLPTLNAALNATSGVLLVIGFALIKNGHIYAPDRGYVAFTVPGMADFIHRRYLD